MKNFTLSSELERLNGGNCSEGIRRGSEFCGAILDKEGSKVRGIGHVVVCNEPELVCLNSCFLTKTQCGIQADKLKWCVNRPRYKAGERSKEKKDCGYYKIR